MIMRLWAQPLTTCLQIWLPRSWSHCHNTCCDRAGPLEHAYLLTASHVAHSLAPARVPPGAVHALYCKSGSPVSLTDMRAARHFAAFAMAAYGTLYYVYLDPKPHKLVEMCCGRLCPLWCGEWPWGHGLAAEDAAARPRKHFKLQNPAEVMSHAAICDVAGITRGDLRHVHSTNRFNESVPYFVALDRASDTVVISIRGTLSIDDAMTDLMCHPAAFAGAHPLQMSPRPGLKWLPWSCKCVELALAQSTCPHQGTI